MDFGSSHTLHYAKFDQQHFTVNIHTALLNLERTTQCRHVRSGGIAPRLPNFHTASSFGRFTPEEITPVSTAQRLGGPLSRCGRGCVKEINLALLGVEPRSSTTYSSHYTDCVTRDHKKRNHTVCKFIRFVRS
jgi:hypothetical protein